MSDHGILYRRLLLVFILTLVVLMSLDAKAKDRAGRDFYHADSDGNGELSRDEWKRRGNFERLDADRDGLISLKELRAMYKGHNARGYTWPPDGVRIPKVEIDPSILINRLAPEDIRKEALCGLTWKVRGCTIGDQVPRGMSATGTGPRFPEGLVCPGIDDYWAMDYTHKRGFKLFHGGIDLPVPWGTPMRAVADGSVVAIFEAGMSKRGIEVVLRHTPDQTGHPMWTYSLYGHMDQMPKLVVGQKVGKGQILGPTGNSGISGRGGGQSRNRRPAIHFATLYSDNPNYTIINNIVVPKDGYWLDPIAFYRQQAPYDTASVKALPEARKYVDIPVMLEDGSIRPPATKIIWPYACRKG